MYETEAAREHARARERGRWKGFSDVHSSSDSEDTDETVAARGAWAWDKQQLQRIQLDERTITRAYRRIYVVNAVRKDDCVVMTLCSHEATQEKRWRIPWAHRDVAF